MPQRKIFFTGDDTTQEDEDSKEGNSDVIKEDIFTCDDITQEDKDSKDGSWKELSSDTISEDNSKEGSLDESNTSSEEMSSDTSSDEDNLTPDVLLREVILNDIYGSTEDEYHEKLKEGLCEGLKEKEAKAKAKRHDKCQ